MSKAKINEADAEFFLAWARSKVVKAANIGEQQCVLFPEEYPSWYRSKGSKHDAYVWHSWICADPTFNGTIVQVWHRRCGFQNGILIKW